MKAPLAASEQHLGGLEYHCCLLGAFAAEDLSQERISAVSFYGAVSGALAERISAERPCPIAMCQPALCPSLASPCRCPSHEPSPRLRSLHLAVAPAHHSHRRSCPSDTPLLSVFSSRVSATRLSAQASLLRLVQEAKEQRRMRQPKIKSLRK